VRARLATIQPRVPVVSASPGGKPGHYLDGLVTCLSGSGCQSGGSGKAGDNSCRKEE
jgi:hypothetical protein